MCKPIALTARRNNPDLEAGWQRDSEYAVHDRQANHRNVDWWNRARINDAAYQREMTERARQRAAYAANPNVSPTVVSGCSSCSCACRSAKEGSK